MDNKSSTNRRFSLWTHTAAGAIRVAFGLAWGIDAYLKWQPDFYKNYLDYITSIISGQPQWLLPWFNFWNNIISMNPGLFAWLTRIIETVIAVGLLAGFARKWIYVLGGGFALLIWSIPEGFGGPYAPGATDVGGGLIYVFLFVALILMDYMLGRSPYSLDYYIERKNPGWHVMAEWAPAFVLQQDVPYLSWSIQAVTIVGLIIMFFLFVAILTSELTTNPASSALITEWFKMNFQTVGLRQVLQLI
jgi:nitrite reductase (NO-forming)